MAGQWRIGWLAVIAVLVSMQGCLSSTQDGAVDGRSANTTGTEGETISANESAVESTSEKYQFGMIKNGTFTKGKVDVGVAELAAGGSASLTVAVVDATGTPVSDQFDVTFNSPCNGNGLAAIASPVKTINGVATSTYQAKGCSGDDVITARIAIDKDSGDELQALGTIKVQPADLGSIEFLSTEPSTIALRGMSGVGLSHTSTVRFRVVNATGGPVANQEVTFSLNTSVGGIELQPDRGRTDAQGVVQTVVQAGDVHTSVRVTAETQGTTGEIIRTQSSQLVISTGIPDQDSVSLSLSVHNPEAMGYDGEAVDVNVYASDRYNNPVPDGTAVSFYTELGQIEPSCQTKNGFCSVKWRSSNPRNLDDPNDVADLAQRQVGRSAITAVMIGEDSFIDQDGDGVFSTADLLKTDEGEVFQDWREGAIDAAPSHEAFEPFLDFNKDGERNPDGDGKFTGLGCKSGCSGALLKHVYDRAVLVMAESGLSLTHDVAGNQISLNKANGEVSRSFTVTVKGAAYGQVPPAGTTVSVSTDVGKLYGPTSFKMPSSNSRVPVQLGYTLSVDEVSESKSGRIEIKATTPKGVVSYGYTIGVSVIVGP